MVRGPQFEKHCSVVCDSAGRAAAVSVFVCLRTSCNHVTEILILTEEFPAGLDNFAVREADSTLRVQSCDWGTDTD